MEDKLTTIGKALVKKIFILPTKNGDIRILGCQVVSGWINKLGLFNLYRG